MKTQLTIEESAKLIELGVDAKLASKHTFGVQIPTDIPNVYRKVDGGEPIFTLADLFSILPKEIDGYHLSIEASNKGYDVDYELWDSIEDRTFFMGSSFAPELIDSLNQLVIYCLENGHLKTEKE